MCCVIENATILQLVKKSRTSEASQSVITSLCKIGKKKSLIKNFQWLVCAKKGTKERIPKKEKTQIPKTIEYFIRCLCFYKMTAYLH